MQYYSQYEQDKFLDTEIFKGMENGVFVEIGADDGIRLSNTYFFEKSRNWTGVCIEPRSEAFKMLRCNRKCICENIGIALSAGRRKFLRINGSGEMLSGIIDNFSKEHLDRINSHIDGPNIEEKIVSVYCLPLQKLFDKHGICFVDYCSIDTEGGEIDIIKSIDFKKVKIRYFSIENKGNDKKVRQFMEKLGYRLTKKLGIDDIYELHDLSLKANLSLIYRKYIKTIEPISRLISPVKIEFVDQFKFWSNSRYINIFDVGANRGQTAIQYRSVFPLAKIYSFEPYNKIADEYGERFKYDYLAVLFQLSVGLRMGVSELYLNRSDYTNSTLPALSLKDRIVHDDDNQLISEGKIKARAITLDYFSEKYHVSYIHILKADVQGGELFVLKGAKRMLSLKKIGLIYLEVSFAPLYKGQALFFEVCEYLQKFGYRPYKIYNLSHSISTGQLLCADCLFVCNDVNPRNV